MTETNIACVQFECTDVGNVAPWEGAAEPRLYRLGYFWWVIDGWNCELQYLRFRQQILFPKHGIETGYGYRVAPGITCKFHLIYRTAGLDAVQVAGQVIDMLGGQLGGLGNVGISGAISHPPTATSIGTNKRLLGRLYD